MRRVPGETCISSRFQIYFHAILNEAFLTIKNNPWSECKNCPIVAGVERERKKLTFLDKRISLSFTNYPTYLLKLYPPII